MKKFKLFLSYCTVDSDLVDMLEQAILNSEYAYIFDISRYTRDVGYRGDFQKYMDSIGEHDFVITLISDAYLRSQACMYEISKLFAGNSLGKFLYIVVNKQDEAYCSRFSFCGTKAADIYSYEGQLAYIKYWDNERSKLESLIKELERPHMHQKATENLCRVEHILYHEIDQLLKYLHNHKSICFLDVERDGPSIIFGEDILYKKIDFPPLAREERFKKALQDCIRPIYAPGTTIGNAYFIGNLPIYFEIENDYLLFNNHRSERLDCGVGVREFGPGAWSPSISLPAGAFFRRVSNGGQTLSGWCRAKEELTMYIETVGNGIDVIEIEKIEGDHSAVWTRYTAYDIDLGE